jgi:hypothetical protein
VQRENQDYNIRVNTICPGMVVTESMKFCQAGPQQVLYPEDIADLALWRCRDERKGQHAILIRIMLICKCAIPGQVDDCGGGPGSTIRIKNEPGMLSGPAWSRAHAGI